MKRNKMGKYIYRKGELEGEAYSPEHYPLEYLNLTRSHRKAHAMRYIFVLGVGYSTSSSRAISIYTANYTNTVVDKYR